jgi:hypothetical protein
MISLLGLEPKADRKIRVAGWFGAPPSDGATPLAPEFAKIPGKLFRCCYCVEEKDSGCRHLADKRRNRFERWGPINSGTTKTRSPKIFRTAFAESRRSKCRLLHGDEVRYAWVRCRGLYRADARELIAPGTPNPLGDSTEVQCPLRVVRLIQ